MTNLSIIIIAINLPCVIIWITANIMGIKLTKRLVKLAMDGLLAKNLQEEIQDTIKGIKIIKSIIRWEIAELVCCLSIAATLAIINYNFASIIWCLCSLLSIRALKKSKKILYKTQDYLKLLES